MGETVTSLSAEVANCRICAERFGATATAHRPRPVAWLSQNAPILIAGQAPGARGQASGIPFDDPSGDRLREWLGVDRDVFYDRETFAILPMAFCFPGYNAKGSDLPPPKVCADNWRARALAAMGQIRLKVLVGGYAQKWHLGKVGTVTETVQNWHKWGADVIALPHPSWRNTGWIKKNLWFEAELLPVLRARVNEVLNG